MRIISLASTIWTARWMNRQQLMSRLGKRHAVLYSNASWRTWSRHSPEWRNAPIFGSFEQRDNVWVDRVSRFTMRTARVRVIDEFVTEWHVRRWLNWAATHGDGPLILHLFEPEYVDYIEKVRPDGVVYQPYDWFELMPGWSTALELAERRLLQRADRVIVPSKSFAEGLEKKSNRSVEVVPNGVDIDLFSQALDNKLPAPPDLSAIPSPRLGYIGWLEHHVDLSLILDLARRRSEWNFVFVGGRTPHPSERLVRELEACCRLPNIHFLGPKERTEVPAYMINMDANLICWRVGEGGWADVGYPLKLQEYLASGRGVVSADLHSVRTMLSNVIRTAKSLPEWEVAIEETLRTGGLGTSEQRVSIARENSWDRRSEQLEGILLQLGKPIQGS